jgi:hypothetical protein
MFKLITNIWTNPVTTLRGLLEGAGLLGAGGLVLDVQQLKIMALVAAWRVIYGALRPDTRKVVDEVLVKAHVK